MESTNTADIEDVEIARQPASKESYSFWETGFGETIRDHIDGAKAWRMWTYMAFAEIRRRYRRTAIGPFWSTLSLAIFVGSMGILFSLLWHTDIKVFLPYFASGFVCWTFFSAIIIEGCQTFIAQEGLIKQVALPYSLFSWLVIARGFLIFLHQIVIFIAIAFLFHVKVDIYTLLVIPGFLLLFVNGLWITALLGLLCARFRDVQQIVNSILQIAMFVTPIFWPEKQLGHGIKAHILVNGNPLYHFVTIVRQPLIGEEPKLLSWLVVIGITIVGWLLTLYVMSRKRRKLIFWLL